MMSDTHLLQLINMQQLIIRNVHSVFLFVFGKK